MGGEEPPTNRPRWSFTWLLRIQRVGRDRRERQVDGEVDRKDLALRIGGYVILALVLAFEVWLAVRLGFQPF